MRKIEDYHHTTFWRRILLLTALVLPVSAVRWVWAEDEPPLRAFQDLDKRIQHPIRALFIWGDMGPRLPADFMPPGSVRNNCSKKRRNIGKSFQYSPVLWKTPFAW